MSRYAPYKKSETAINPLEVEKLLESAYPVVRQRADALTKEIYDNARLQYGRHSMVTMYAAREIMLMLVLKTGGDILL